MSSAKSRPFCLGLFVLTQGCRDKLTSFLQTTYFSERKSTHFDTDFFKVVCKGPAENKLIISIRSGNRQTMMNRLS